MSGELNLINSSSCTRFVLNKNLQLLISTAADTHTSKFQSQLFFSIMLFCCLYETSNSQSMNHSYILFKIHHEKINIKIILLLIHKHKCTIMKYHYIETFYKLLKLAHKWQNDQWTYKKKAGASGKTKTYSKSAMFRGM